MRRTLLTVALAAVLLAPALRAQTTDAPLTIVPACPSTATLDQLITAIDAAVSGPANKDRACFRQLFAPDARLIPIHMAHLWSTYETLSSDPPPTGGKAPEPKLLDRGINSIQAVYDGKQWRVQEILWQAETPADPVPQKYLP